MRMIIIPMTLLKIMIIQMNIDKDSKDESEKGKKRKK